ncbi:MAG TPA: hypothetical protein V6D04_00565, partial [Candidatus Obscuribacterales bacterium]
MPQVLHGKSPQPATSSSGSPASDVYAHLQTPLSDNPPSDNSAPQAAATKPIIQLQSVTKTYSNGSRGLLGVNLEVKR